MSDRLHLAHVDQNADDDPPGWYFWDLSGGARAVVTRCAHCGSQGMLTSHSIEPSGEVNASIYCCEPGHAFYVLVEARFHRSRSCEENNPYAKGSDLHGRWLSGWRSEQARAMEHTDILGTK